MYSPFNIGQMLRCFTCFTKKRQGCAIELTSASVLKILFVSSFIVFSVHLNSSLTLSFHSSCNGWSFRSWSRNEFHQRYWYYCSFIIIACILIFYLLSVIPEILYFLFFRRFFLWYRTNWSTQKIEKQSSVKPSISSLHTVQYKRRISNFSTTSSVPASMTTLTSLTSLTFPHLPIPLMTPSPLTNTIPPPVSNETHFQFPPATPATSTILPLPFQMISTISNPSMDVHPKVVRRASLDLPPLLQARLNKY